MTTQSTGTVTILFTDLVNSTELLQKAGDDRAQRILRAHHDLLKQAVAQNGGHEVKWLGDGLMVAFTSTADAVRCAIAMQQASGQAREGDRLSIRVGLNVGEVLREASDYFGTPVVVARRLCDRADPGQILAGALVPALLSGRPEFRFRELGSMPLKGIAEPLLSCEVLYQREPAAPRLLRMPFVGRDSEMSRLQQRFADALARKGGLVALAGEPGIGKTRLAEEFCEEARRQGGLVLWGRCHEGEASRPYGPFVETIEEYARSSDPGRLAEELGPDGRRICKLAPALETCLGDLPATTPLEPEEERFRLLDAVARFFAAVSSHAPLVLVLEDLHLASAATVAMLRRSARAASMSHMLVLGTYRHADLGRQHPLAHALAEMTLETYYERISLKGLPEAEVGRLLQAVAEQEVPRAFVTAIDSESDGNPLFIRELLLHLIEEGRLLQEDGRWISDPAIAETEIPEGVRNAIERRLSRLSEGAKQALAHGSVLGRNFDFDVVAAFTERDEQSLLEALEEAVAAQLIEETKGRFGASCRFTHELVRQTLYAQMSIARRRALHLRAGRTLEAIRASHLDSIAGQLARHFRQGNHRGKAIEYSLRAGELAREIYAFEEAAAHWEAALELIDAGPAEREERAGLLERLAELMYNGGVDPEKGIVFLEQALQAREDLGDERRSARIHSRLGVALSTTAGTTTHYNIVDIPRALQHYRAALAKLEDEPPGTALGYAWVGLSSAAFLAVNTTDGLPAAGRALELGERLGDQGLWATAALARSVHLVAGGHLAEGFDLIERSWELADRLGLAATAAFAASNRASWMAHWLCDPLDAGHWLERELAKDRVAQAVTRRAYLIHDLGTAYCWAGELERAGALGDEARAGRWLPSVLGFFAGDWERVEGWWLEDRNTFRRGGNRQAEAGRSRYLAELYRLRGDTESAERVLQELIATGLQGPSVPVELGSRAALALLYAETGRHQGAEPHLSRCRELVTGGEDWRGLSGRIALAEAAAAAAEHIDAAQQHLQSAIETFRRYSLPWNEAEALYVWGRLLLQDRKRARAKEKFEGALAVYARVGAGEPWKERVRSLLRRLGSTPGAPVYPGDLTEREVEVLRWIARGWSSRDIAEELLMSVRTVERHITNIYRKIGAHGKAAATRYALEHGLK